jgi:leucyl/phenylalanyl-tRNA--protein transferase
MAHRAAGSALWAEAWRTQPAGGPAILGGEYDPDVIEAAYRNGYFPMVQDPSWRVRFRGRVPRPRVPVLPGSADPYELTWWAPPVRPVIIRSTVRAGRRLRQTLRTCGWSSTVNQDFAGVVRRCGPGRGESTWLSEKLVRGYLELHERGVSHSVEIWERDELVAGAFGSVIGGVFCGDSAFRTRDYAAKVAILDLCQRFMDAGVVLVDCQDHRNGLDSIGSVLVGFDDYREVLRRTTDWRPTPAVDPRPVARLVDWLQGGNAHAAAHAQVQAKGARKGEGDR